jgi:hypothetical protein
MFVEIFNAKSWVGQPTDWQPKAKIGLHAVAVSTNLQPNDGNGNYLILVKILLNAYFLWFIKEVTVLIMLLFFLYL